MADNKVLSSEESDVLGEIANMSMGSAATALSQILSQDVSITTPHVEVKEFEELFGGFSAPYVAIKVNFTEGIQGFNLLILKIKDAKTILRIMMGDRVADDDSLNEMEMSALSEVMNQMMGGCATALNQLYKSPISISTPELEMVDITQSPDARPQLGTDETLVTVTFDFKVGTAVDSQAVQVTPLSSARQQAGIMLNYDGKQQRSKATVTPDVDIVVEKADFPPLKKAVSLEQPRNIEMLMDIPLEASVILGSVTKTVRQILSLSEGSVLELDKLVEEQVELIVNGIPVARGEIVVINENFGLRITEVISSSKRLESVAGIRKV